MWPAEGSVSPGAAAIFAGEGVQWIASDEGVLFRSLPAGAEREALYQAYRYVTEQGEIAMVFRDHGLSDLLGFTYQKLEARAAVTDLFGHLAAIGGAGASPLVSLILDGENPWEHYPNGGQEFLERLYEALERRERDVAAVLLSTRLSTDASHEIAATPACRVLDRSQLPDLDRSPRGPRRHGRRSGQCAGSGRTRGDEAWTQPRWREPTTSCSLRRAATGSGGSATISSPRLLQSSTACSAIGFGLLACTSESEPPLSLRSPISRLAKQEVAADDGALPEALLHPTIDGHAPLTASGAGPARFRPGRPGARCSRPRLPSRPSSTALTWRGSTSDSDPRPPRRPPLR